MDHVELILDGLTSGGTTDSIGDKDRRPKVVIVDDDPELRLLLSRVLSHACNIAMAPDGDTALALISARGAELVVSDLEMPRMRGTELLRRARELDPDIGFIILTGCGDPEYDSELLRVPPEQLIQKPFDIHHLKHTVAHVLEQRRLARISRLASMNASS